MTRAAPARILGLTDHGHLAPGAVADITVYASHADREAMFSAPEYVYKDGVLVTRKGRVVAAPRGVTHTVKPDYDHAIEKPLREYFERYHTLAFDNFAISDDEMIECGSRAVHTHPCARAA